jgi:RNA polymerase sigma-70 factor (ECF subfamily)
LNGDRFIPPTGAKHSADKTRNADLSVLIEASPCAYFFLHAPDICDMHPLRTDLCKELCCAAGSWYRANARPVAKISAFRVKESIPDFQTPSIGAYKPGFFLKLSLLGANAPLPLSGKFVRRTENSTTGFAISRISAVFLASRQSGLVSSYLCFANRNNLLDASQPQRGHELRSEKMEDTHQLDDWFFREVLPLEPLIVDYLRRNWTNEAEIEDLRQEVYVRVYEAAIRERPPLAKPFVFQVAQNLLLAKERRDKVIPIGSLSDLNVLNLPSDEPSPERKVSAHQELDRLQAALDSLPQRCREVFILRKIHGVSQRDVAHRLGICENTVERHLINGVRLLAQSASDRRGSVISQSKRFLRNSRLSND